MERETLTSLVQSCIDYTLNTETSSPTTRTNARSFFIKEINRTVRWIYDYLNLYKTEFTNSAITTTSGTQYYNKKNFMGNIVSITVTINGIAYPCTPIDSYDAWNRLNAQTYSGTVIPRFFFQRQSDFGIYPTPGTTGSVVTVVYNPALKDMTLEDYTTGTIAVTNGDATVEGTGATFTGYAGKWLKIDDDGYWYRISSITDADTLELEKNFEGTTDASSTFIIADTPELPPELHQFIPHRVVAVYEAGPRHNPDAAQSHLNYFFTGDFSNIDRTGRNVKSGLIGYKQRYDAMGRSNSHIINRNFSTISRYDDTLTTVTV